jgi:predicted XRE-type DNA-binding protein
MIGIERFVDRSRLTRARVAARLGFTQSRLNALIKGNIDQFDLDDLVNAAARAGLHVELRITPAKRGWPAGSRNSLKKSHERRS